MRQDRDNQQDKRYCMIYVRVSFDWRGSQGIELSIDGIEETFFASTFKLVLQDFYAWCQPHLSQTQLVEFKRAEKKYMIQPPMAESEKTKLNQDLTEWVLLISK